MQIQIQRGSTDVAMALVRAGIQHSVELYGAGGVTVLVGTSKNIKAAQKVLRAAGIAA